MCYGGCDCERCTGKPILRARYERHNDYCALCGQVEANHDLQYDEILCPQFVSSKEW